MVNLKYIPTDSEINAIKVMSNDARADLTACINATDPFSIFDSVEGKEGKEIICPICGSGSGKKHTGVKPTFENGKWLYNCFACGSFSGDLILIIAGANNLDTRADFFQVLAIGAKIIGQIIPADVSKNVPVKKNKSRAKSVQKVAEYSRLAEARKNLAAFVESQRGNWRGLSLELLQHLSWGYLKDYRHPDNNLIFPAVIIPNDLNGIFAREVGGDRKSNISPMSTTTIFLPLADEFDLIVVEGAINGASILEVIAEPKFGIVASGGTSGNKNVLARVNQLVGEGKKVRVMVAYDNDKSGAGQKASADLLQMLKNASIVAVAIDITKTADIDLNDVLRNNGREKLAEMVNSAVDAAQIELEKVAAEMETAPADETCANDSDLAAQIEYQKQQRQAAEKEIAAFDEEKEAAIEHLKSIEKFDFDTVFAAEVITGAAFAKLYEKSAYARACVDIQANNKDSRFLQNWKSAVKEKAEEIFARVADLKIKAAEISAKIDTLQFRSDNDILKNYEIPDGFSITKTGEVVKLVKDFQVTICRVPVVITKEFFGVDTKFYKYAMTFKKDNKWQDTPPLEQATIADSRKLIPAVANYGLQFNSTNASGVVDYLDAILAKNAGKFKKILTARQFGWQEYNGEEIFLDPRRNCTVEVEGVKVPFVADNSNSQFAKTLTSAGTIEEWKKAYDLAKKYSVARFIVAACVAAPLLKILGLRNFALHFYGKSRAGKTTALLLGVSAVGNEKMVRTFDATKNGLLGAAAESNDYVFAVDEKQAADRKIAESLANFVYDYCEGRPRTKLNRDSTLKAGVEWRGDLITTGETSLFSNNVTGGAHTRAIQFHVKEILPREIAADIRRIIKRNYGHIQPRVIDKIFEIGTENLREDFKAYEDDFTKAYSEVLPEYCGNIAAVILADSLLNQVLGVEKEIADIDAADLADEILKIVPTINEISDTEREKDFVTSWIVQNLPHFEGSNKYDEKRGLKGFGRFDRDKNFLYIVANKLSEDCNLAGYDYQKVVADLVEDNFFIPSKAIEKGRKTPRPTVTKKIDGINTRCLQIPLSILEAE